jgi:hypothetical protein
MLTGMSDAAAVPAQRAAEQEIAIRELGNAGKVIAELTVAGEVGRVTSGGRLVGWLMPATRMARDIADPGQRVNALSTLVAACVAAGGHDRADSAEQRIEELTARGLLRPPERAGGLAGWRPLPRRTDVPPLSETLEQMRSDERT